MTESQTQWIYGGDDIDDGLAASHEGLLRELIGGISRQQMDNGTLQLRAGSEAVRMLFHRLGVTTSRAHEKRVPETIFTAPVDVQAAFLRGLFGADGCVSANALKSNRYVGLGSSSELLLKDVQRLLNAFGIASRIYAARGPAAAKLTYTRRDGTAMTYLSRQMFDLRIQGQSLELFEEWIGFSTPRKNSSLCEDPRVEQAVQVSPLHESREPRARRTRSRLQPQRTAASLVHRRRRPRRELLRIYEH